MVVIPYQFRSVSMLYGVYAMRRGLCRNPLSIQVCFNKEEADSQRGKSVFGRNPLSIQVCFNIQGKMH